MMVDLNKLSQPSLSAAMRGGTDGWGKWGSANYHILYMEPIPKPRKNIRNCSCGCKKRSRFRGMANGVCLMMGCEASVSRWVGKKEEDYLIIKWVPSFV